MPQDQVSAPSPPASDSEISAALQDIFGGILRDAKARRANEEGYQHLFSAFKDGGLAHAVFEAEKAMWKTADHLLDVIREGTGQETDADLYAVVLALPLVIRLVRKDIEKDEGFGCCQDKARLVLKTYFYDKLCLDIEAVPFRPAQPAG